MNAKNWIIDNSSDQAECDAPGHFPTPEGRLSVIDPLCSTEARFIEVPTTGGDLLVISDGEGYWERFALIFADGEVAGGTHEFDCLVDGGVASPVTPASLNALNTLRRQIPQVYPKGHPNARYPAPNLYIEHFEQFDEAGAEPLKASLPDGTLMPYIHSGFGDGAYPVFTLTDQAGANLAVYCDFLGNEELENWVAPPGVTVTE